MKAIVAIYKSEAIGYLRENNILQEDAKLIYSVDDFKTCEADYDDVVILSRPMGMPNDNYIREQLLKKGTPVKPVKPTPKAVAVNKSVEEVVVKEVKEEVEKKDETVVVDIVVEGETKKIEVSKPALEAMETPLYMLKTDDVEEIKPEANGEN